MKRFPIVLIIALWSTAASAQSVGLFADPLETSNLAAQNGDEVRRLKGPLERWMAQARANGKMAAADPETRRALRALGYL